MWHWWRYDAYFLCWFTFHCSFYGWRSWIFHLLALCFMAVHSLKTSVKRYANIEKAATSIIISIKMKNILNDINRNTFTYNSEQKQIVSIKHTKSEFTVSWRQKQEQNDVISPSNVPPLAREEVLARMKSYNLHWKLSINDWNEYNAFVITPLHESCYNEAELCRRLHYTEEAKLLINSNQVIFFWCYLFYSEGGWKKDDDGHMIPIDLLCCIFALVQKKDGDSCTMNLDGHCCNVQSIEKLMRVFGHVRHSFML